MSGPKTARYTLTAEQRRILAEQRRIQRELQKNSNMLKKNIADLKEIIVKVDDELGQYKRIVAETGEGNLQLDKLDARRNQAMQILNDAGKTSEKSGLDSLKMVNSKLNEITKAMIADEMKITSELEKVDEAFKDQVEAAISEGFTLSFIKIEETEEDSLSLAKYTAKIDKALSEICAYHISAELVQKFEQLKLKAAEIESVDFIENFYAMSILPFMKECRNYNSFYIEYGAKYEELYLEYQLLSSELGVIPKQYVFSQESITSLQEVVLEMQQTLQKKEEQEYISQCIDTAMKEMGYRVIGEREVARKDGRRFTNELYLFDEGTAVNVTYSSEGQITMELGGLDTQDRIPSESECQSLAQEMSYFCEDYLKIEERLKAMGVVSHRISVLPPDAQFAQIINTSDYQMNETTTKYESKKTRRGAESQNYLRRDE